MGNVATCTFALIVTDATDPVITNCPADLNSVSVDAACIAAPDIQAATLAYTDNCEANIADAVTTNDAPANGEFPIGDNVVTYTVTDAASNVAVCSQAVKVADTTDPEVGNCPTAPVVTDANAGDATVGCYYALATLPDIGPTDNCAGASVTNDGPYANEFQFPLGDTTVTWTVTDASGNTNTACSQAYTIEEHVKPTIDTCPSDATVPVDISCAVATAMVDPASVATTATLTPFAAPAWNPSTVLSPAHGTPTPTLSPGR